ncbi:MAG: CAP domain-containing protein [Thainema sp.]
MVRRHRARAKTGYLLPQKWAIGLITSVFLLAALVDSRELFYFSNGSGEADWRIGEPTVTVWTAHQTRSQDELKQFALELANRDRTLNGLPALVEDPLLSKAAQGHAEDMLKRDFFDHVSPEGKTPTDRYVAVGGETGAGENIAYFWFNLGINRTYGLAEEFQKGWMYSDGHRENLLRPEYTHFGYGIYVDSGKAYAVQMFR